MSRGAHVAPPAVPSRYASSSRPPVARRFISRTRLEQLGVGDLLDPSLPALGREVEDGRVAVHAHVVLPQGREAEGAVLLRVRLAADAEERLVEQAGGGRERLLARELVAAEVLARPALAASGACCAKAIIRSNLSASRRARQTSWYRYCRRPAASVPTACTWPFGSGQIHTSVHAGGIASARMRSRISGSRTGRPSAVHVREPSPAAAGRSPARRSSPSEAACRPPAREGSRASLAAQTLATA